MKKILSLVLCIVLVMTVFSACGSKNAAVKTGFAVVTEASKSKSASAEGDGVAQANSTAVAVLVDKKGVIRNCVIDVVQPKINFSAAGEVTTDLGKRFDSKKVLKEAYGMKGASPIGKEWYEQAAALEDYVIGKTLEEVKGIKIEGGYPKDEDLVSSVTMNVAEIMSALEKAVNNAQDLGAKASDKLGIGIAAAIGHATANASDDGDGKVQADNHYAVVSLDKKGKITSSIVDATQAVVSFSKEGEITSDLTADVQTKLEKKEAYGMKGASPIGKEWYEQSEAFSKYIKGKTVDDVAGIALEGGSAAEEDLASSVTVTITDFIAAVESAGAAAR